MGNVFCQFDWIFEVWQYWEKFISEIISFSILLEALIEGFIILIYMSGNSVKVVILGDSGVGKTSLIQRYISGKNLRESQKGLFFNAILKVPMQFFILFCCLLFFL